MTDKARDKPEFDGLTVKDVADKARDEARIDFLARKTPDNYIHGSHLLLATFEIGFKAAWDHLWPIVIERCEIIKRLQKEWDEAQFRG